MIEEIFSFSCREGVDYDKMTDFTEILWELTFFLVLVVLVVLSFLVNYVTPT